MGMVLALKTGELAADSVTEELKQAADSMTLEQVRELAKTKHKGLPDHTVPSPPDGNSQGQKTAGVSAIGKAENAFGKLMSNVLGKLPSKKAVTHADDVIAAKKRMGPIEAGIMSGTGVNKIISGPVHKARIKTHFENDLLPKGEAGELFGADTIISAAAKTHGKQSRKVHHSLYSKGDIGADLPVGIEVSKTDKALYNAAKYAPTAGVVGYAANSALKHTPNAEIPTGWQGGDWSKYSSANSILERWAARLK